MRACKYCGDEVTSTNPEIEFCRGCYYSGRPLDEKYAPLIDDIDAGAYWHHTGGGCWVLNIPLSNGGFLWASADQDVGEPDNDEDGPWWIGRYTADDDEEAEFAEHLDRAGLLDVINREVAK